MEKGLRVTISSDDPGIFVTNLKKEYELAISSGLSQLEIEKIKELPNSYKSKILLGRKP